MNAFIVELTNTPGELARVAEAIAQKGINIEGFAGADRRGRGHGRARDQRRGRHPPRTQRRRLQLGARSSS